MLKNLSLFGLFLLISAAPFPTSIPNKSTSPIGAYLSRSVSFRSLPEDQSLSSLIESLEFSVLDDYSSTTPGTITSASLKNLHLAVEGLKYSTNNPQYLLDVTTELNNLDRIFLLASRHLQLLPYKKNTLISLHKRDSTYDKIVNINSEVQGALNEVDIASDTSSELKPIVKTLLKRTENRLLQVYSQAMAKLDNPKPISTAQRLFSSVKNRIRIGSRPKYIDRF